MKINAFILKLTLVIEYGYLTLILIAVLVLVIYQGDLFEHYDELINALIQTIFKT